MDHKTRKMPSRLLCLCLVAVMLLAMVPANVLQAEAVSAGQIIYFKPNSNWKSASARFAAYFFGNGDKWVDMSASDVDGLYYCKVPSGGYTKVIFARMNPNTTANNFNEGTRWNQTDDLDLPTNNNNLFTLNGDWATNGTWSAPDYYLVGSINGSDYYNTGNYHFNNGKLTVTFTKDSHVIVKDKISGVHYMTAGWLGESVTSAKLHDSATINNDNKLFVPAGVEVTFTLTKNSDGTLTLSYTTSGSTTPTTPTNPPETTPTTPPVTTKEYYLIGWINGGNYGCENDSANMGNYKFVNGKVTARFNQDSYVFIKTAGNADWYMSKSYEDGTSATLHNTSTGANQKLKVPGNVDVTFTLTENSDGTLTLSYTTPGSSTTNTVVDIPTGTFSGDDADTLYIGTTLYDYYTDYEVEGNNRDTFTYSGDFQDKNWISFGKFNQALSSYYDENDARVPIYVGHFQPHWGDGKWSFRASGIALYGFEDGKGYNASDNDQKWFMSVNNSGLDLTPTMGHYAEASQKIVYSQLDADHTLLIDKDDNLDGTMDMPLFNEAFLNGTNSQDRKIGQVYKNVMFPFTKGDNGNWVFDSRYTTLQMQQDSGGAYFLANITDNKNGFENTNSAGDISSNQYGFFPFNSNGNYDNAHTYNYGFGARLDIKFNLTKDGKTEDGKDIIFSFSGDDDVWVFIDDQLVLDIGGCHGRVGGDINFNTMKATVDAVKSSGSDHNPDTDRVKEFTLKGKNTDEHTLTMFYMERGMWESNMMLEFNFFPVPETSMNVQKVWDVDNTNDIHEVKVQLQSQDATGNWGDVDTPVTLTAANNWRHSFTGLDYDLQYRVVELNNKGDMIPHGGLTDKVDNRNALVVNYSDVTGTADKGYSQTITNKTQPAGQLRITKAVANGATGTWAKNDFEMMVKVGGSAYTGNYYIEGAPDTTYEADNGKVKLSAGQTAIISLTAGSSYSVKEVNDRDPNYMAGYTGTTTSKNTFTCNSMGASGQLESGASASVIVTNYQVGSQVVVIDFGIPVDIDIVDNVLGELDGNVKAVGSAANLTKGFFSNQCVQDNEFKAAHGKATIEGNKIRYTPTDMEMDAPDVIGYAVEYQEDGSDDKSYYHSTVTVVPATNIYYEDSFLQFEHATGGTTIDGTSETFGVWVGVGTQENKTQQQDRPGVNSALGALDANNIYGYDQAYDNFTTYSLGSAHKVTVQGPSDPTSTDFIGHKDNAPTANFSFTGTGFDVVSLTSGDSGCLWVSVKDASGNPVRSIVVSNYYGYDYGLYNVTYKYDGAAWIQYINEKATENATEQKAEKPANPVKDQEVSGVEYVWAVVDNASDTLYQVPVIKVENLAHGTYTVEMKVVYLVSQDMQKTGSYTVYLDAIRVYNPAKGNDDVENHYKSDNEFEPTYVNIRDHIVNGIEENEYANGIGYVDGRHYQSADVGAFEGSYIDKYDSPSPNNEAYLMKDDGFVFKLRYYGEESPAGGQFHIGAKLATAGTATAAPRYATLVVTCQKETSWPTVQHKIQTCTSMFYKGVDLTWNLVTDGEDSYYETNAIYVRSADNTEGAILSLTDLKITLPVVSASENNVSEDDLKVIVDTEAAGFVKDIWDAENELANPGINLAYPTLSLDGEVKYNFYYTIESNNIAIEDMGLITWSTKPEDATFAAAETVIPGAIFNAATGEYMVRTNGIPAKKLGDYLYFRVYAKLSDGSYVYSTLACYSAKYYAMDRLANSENANTKALCVAMLNYGAAAQMYFGYNTDNLMNADLTAEQKALVSAYSADMVDALTAADAAKTGDFVASGAFNTGYPSVSFEGAFAINYYFVPNKTIDGDLTLYCWDLETYNSVDKLTEDNATAKVVMTQTATGEYFGSYTGIAAKQIDETVFAAGVYESDGIRYSTSVVPYSVGTYCVDMAANGSDTMKAFAAETAVFGHYAKIYFDNLQK